jgi:hypothetical protein
LSAELFSRGKTSASTVKRRRPVEPAAIFNQEDKPRCAAAQDFNHVGTSGNAIFAVAVPLIVRLFPAVATIPISLPAIDTEPEMVPTHDWFM